MLSLEGHQWRGPVLWSDTLRVRCKQQPSRQEVNLKQEDPEISLLQETGAQEPAVLEES